MTGLTGAAQVAPVTMLHGFIGAWKRYETAAAGDSATEAFLPLFEALNWCVALDDRLQAWWKTNATNADPRWCHGFRFGDAVLGTRYARNRVHHQWANALFYSLSASAKPDVPRGPEWRWLPIAHLPKPDEGRGWFADEYERELAGFPARDRLTHVLECFSDALGAGVGDPALG